MTNLKIELEGLDKFLADISTESLSKTVSISVAKTTTHLESIIQQEVVSNYSVSSTEVRKTLLRKKRSLQKRGKSILTDGLEYKYRAKPLNEFPFKECNIGVNSRFLVARATKGFSLIKQTTSKGVKVAVRRGKFKTVHGRHGFGAFYQKASSVSKWAAIQGGRSSSRPSGIYERTQEATWFDEPFDRAPIRRAFGLSVTQMIDTLLRNDPLIEQTLDIFVDTLIDELAW